MLIDVLTRIAADTGLHPVQQRDTLIKILNQAAKEMYDRLECSKIYWETTLSVPGNKIVSLPNYIGELRGLRGSTSEIIVPIHGISQPRYTRQDWSYKWNNWRDLGESPVFQQPTVVAPLVISTAAGEPTITFYVNGQTNKAARLEEQVIITTPVSQTIAMFGPQIYALGCRSNERTADITISDANGTVLAILPNISNQCRYKVIDVSEAPWIGDASSNGDTLVDALFKVPLRYLSKDSDSFPGSYDYDNGWYYMAMYLYYKPMQNKPSDYADYFPSALACLTAAKNNSEQQQVKKITFGPNKYYNLTRGANRIYPGSCTNVDNGI